MCVTYRSTTEYLLKLTYIQRPTARDLLKHKFIRMAKKTNYLTELIDRHERWKAEGGERVEEEELHPDIIHELYVNMARIPADR
jgi:hypothetical protein